MEFEIFDSETGHSVGKKEIPADVMEAAAKVEGWLKSQSFGPVIILHGVKLADE